MFIYVGTQPPQGQPAVYLEKDNWNDWFTWITQYQVCLVTAEGAIVRFGNVKIGRKGMSDTNAITQIPAVVPYLDETYFSLGQDENYYETLNTLGSEFRESYLVAMRDCAFNLAILDDNALEPVMSSSLLRDIDMSRVRTRFHRLAQGRVALTAYSFEYHFPPDPIATLPSPVLSFSVRPESLPATNIHVLIGRNGVGKTRCFDLLARSFLNMPYDDRGQPVGKLINSAGGIFQPAGGDPGFAGLVTVSFSAFDSRGPLTGVSSGEKRYAYIGLVTHQSLNSAIPAEPGAQPRVKGMTELSREFAASVIACREGVRRERWERALKTLEADPLFAEANVSSLADDQSAILERRAISLFAGLSSGHAIVLLSITRLVELVEEKSLVLIDEPESHLHPPLLSAFVRALSDLVVNRNGVAIIATHSPVVLQEVPKSCVWKLERDGHEARGERPEIETFGENVGVLTREIFGLEVTQTGFHRLIAEKTAGGGYEQILGLFKGQLGAEGRALARALSLLAERDRTSGKVDE